MSETEATVDAAEMGRLLCLHRRTVLDMAGKGQIPCIRSGRKVIRFRPSEVYAALQSGKTRCPRR